MREIIEQLCTITEEQWGAYAFSRDPIHGRVPAVQQRELASLAAKCGHEEAQKLIQRFGTSNVTELSQKLGLNVKHEGSFGVNDFITFAQFQLPNNITLFMGNVTKAQELIEENELSQLLQNVDIEQLLTAHEMFHFIEGQTPKLYTQVTKIDLWGIGKLRYTSHLICLGEIAAMAFAAELLKLSYSPYVFDVILPWGNNEEKSRKLYEEIVRNAQLAID